LTRDWRWLSGQRDDLTVERKRLMSKSWQRVLIAVPCLLALVGCGRRNEAVKYNNAVAGITKELEAVAKSFDADFQRSLGDPVKSKALHADFANKAGAIIARGRAIVPPNTPEAQALHQAFLSYLDTEDDIIRNELARMLDMLSRGDQLGVQAAAQRVTQREQEKLNELKRAQAELAKANNFKIQ
jgi:hypothetical protein